MAQLAALALLALALIESEPNDSLCEANPLGAVPHGSPLTIEGVISDRFDVDTFEVFVAKPCVVDIRVVTGAGLVPLSGHGGKGGDPFFSPSFIPVLRFFSPDGRLVHVHISSAPCLLMLDVPIPLQGAAFYIELSAMPGSVGAYGLRVSS